MPEQLTTLCVEVRAVPKQHLATRTHAKKN
jgi:hypothetical protein